MKQKTLFAGLEKFESVQEKNLKRIIGGDVRKVSDNLLKFLFGL